MSEPVLEINKRILLNKFKEVSSLYYVDSKGLHRCVNVRDINSILAKTGYTLTFKMGFWEVSHTLT